MGRWPFANHHRKSQIGSQHHAESCVVLRAQPSMISIRGGRVVVVPLQMAGQQFPPAAKHFCKLFHMISDSLGVALIIVSAFACNQLLRYM
jgi:hypothetical protein